MIIKIYTYLMKEKRSELSEKYQKFLNMFNKKLDIMLLLHRKKLDHIIKLLFDIKLIFSPLYNLSQ